MWYFCIKYQVSVKLVSVVLHVAHHGDLQEHGGLSEEVFLELHSVKN